jgi:hypothetical protein
MSFARDGQQRSLVEIACFQAKWNAIGVSKPVNLTVSSEFQHIVR